MNLEERWALYRGTQAPCGYDYTPGDEHIFRDAWNLAITAAAASLPDNWCDSLLTGPKGIPIPAGCPDVEKLIRGIGARIKAMHAEPLQQGGAPGDQHFKPCTHNHRILGGACAECGQVEER